MLFIPLALPELCVAHACKFSALIPVVSYASLGSRPLSPSARIRAFRELNYLSFLCSQKRLQVIKVSSFPGHGLLDKPFPTNVP